MGAASHLAVEMLKSAAGIKLTHVPFKGNADALMALQSGDIQLMSDAVPGAVGPVNAGKVRALAVSSATRFPGAPDIPSAAEAGIPGMEAKLWFGLFAPARTPKPIVGKLNSEVGTILRSPETQETFLKQGVAAAASTPEELADWVCAELVRWTPIIQGAGIRAD